MTYQDLLDHYGSQGAIVQALGAAQSTVSEWQSRGVPPLRQLQIERLTRGRLKADPAVFERRRPEQRPE